MSAPTPSPSPGPPKPTAPNAITIVSHSNLFYWWPVWFLGFIVAGLTYFDNHFMAVVPADTKALRNADVSQVKKTEKMSFEKRDVLVLYEKKHLEPADTDAEPQQPYLRVANTSSYGVIFCITLLLVIVITNVPLRGMWSVMIIVMVIMLTIILWLANLLPKIASTITQLDVRINLAGYLVISCTLFVIWLITLLFFDRQIYMIFTPGQLKVCTEIGGGEKVYDAIGMTLEKQRSDLFRHWILGLGSGDLIVRTSGAQAHQFDLPNVLFIGKKAHDIENLM
jgi:hypothetical protein